MRCNQATKRKRYEKSRILIEITMKKLMLLILVGLLSISGCSEVKYDFKALGFQDKAEMESAFNKGYHTKQKLDQMISVVAKELPPKVIISPPAEAEVTASIAPAPAIEAAPQQPQQSLTCPSVRECAEIMIMSAKTENLSQAMNAAKQIDEMLKPQRGDRKIARKLNGEGLEALKMKKYDEAASIFINAKAADNLDEEIVANLVFTYSEAKDFVKSEKTAFEALLLNPRRANLWLPIAIARQKQGKSKEALQAMWLAWQFTENKQRFLDLIEKRSAEDTDESLKSMFLVARAWFVENKRPSL